MSPTAANSPSHQFTNSPTSGIQQLARDDEALNFARALADRQQLDVAEVLLGGIVLHEAVAAVDLDAVVGDPHGDLARVQLRHRGLFRHAAAQVLEVRGAIGEKTARFDPRRRVRELPLDRLERRDGLSELTAFPRVTAGAFVGALREPDRDRRDPNPPGAGNREGVDKALSFAAYHLRDGHAAALQ